MSYYSCDNVEVKDLIDRLKRIIDQSDEVRDAKIEIYYEGESEYADVRFSFKYRRW